MSRAMSVSLGLVLGGAAAADITPVVPFVGQLREPLNFSTTRISADQPIFGGAAHLVSHDGNTYIHLLAGDTFGGVTITPRTGGFILGWTEGPGIFQFATPVQRFGAYWANNSTVAGASVAFYDSSNTLLGTMPATDPSNGSWTWNGWESTTPFSRVVVSGSGILNGFLWFDDLEATVPAPGAAVLLGIGLPWLARRRR
jgi:hypothetical protein